MRGHAYSITQCYRSLLPNWNCDISFSVWSCNSVGRVPPLQGGGRKFESCRDHQKSLLKRGFFNLINSKYYLRLPNSSLKRLAGRKPTVREALILMVSPVRGSRPVRALRERSWKVPKPGKENFSLVLMLCCIAANTASVISVAVFLVTFFCCLHTQSISSCLVIDLSSKYSFLLPPALN